MNKICKPNSRNLCGQEECQICLPKSFASQPKAQYWSDKNNCQPIQIYKSVSGKYLFNCDKCPHEFKISLGKITLQNRWCAYCANQKLCSDNTCQICFLKSFAAHPKSKYWSPKNKVSPGHVVIGTKDKYLFNCEFGHEFETSLNNITHSKNWCNKCPKKTEAKLYEKLINYGYEIKGQANFNWCRGIKSGKYLPFDFLIEEYKIIVELDGNQHFKQISNWRTPEEQQKIDLYKMDCANKEGYTIVRIYQEDVLFDHNNWWEKLESHFYIHNTPTRIFISSGNQYNCFNK